MRPTRRQTLRALAAAPAAALFPSSLLAACASNGDDTTQDGPVTAAGEAASEGLARFALDLHGQLAKDGGNVFASPWSVWTALAMLSEGARGETRAQIVAAMGLEGAAARADNLRAGARELRGRLARAGRNKKVSMTTADAVWADERFDLSDAFVAAVRQGYEAEAARLDFQGDPDGARKRINAWVEKQTKGRIEDLMPDGSVDPSTELVLTDAIHFKGSWLHEFDEERTQDGAFKRADGSEVQVPLMHLPETHDFPVATILDDEAGIAAHAIELPYVGERVSFLAIVPFGHDGLPALEAWLDAKKLETAIESMSGRSSLVVVPKMKLEQTMKLVDPLQAMGVTDAFSKSAADLSGLSESGRKDLFVNQALHATFLEVDEEGTEAAGATAIGVVRAAVPEAIRLDRPFLFMIRERTTGAVLFLGRMADPTA